jgi:glycosyltransferase involved in cell wall biosynthesis
MASPDLILVGMPTPELCATVARFAERRGVPFIIDVRDLWPDLFLEAVPAWLRPLGGIALWPYAKMNRYSFPRAAGITAISANYLEWGLEYAGRELSRADRVFHMGYPDQPLSPADHAAAQARWLARGVRLDHFICCFFGSMNHQFDSDTILSAAKGILQSPDPRVQFVLCGHAEPATESAIRTADLPNLLMPGWVDGVDIKVLMQMAHAGLVPYRSSPNLSGMLSAVRYPITRIGGKATISNKCLEYLSGGIPVLSSLSGEFETIVKEYDCGLTYRDGHPEGLLAALEILRGDPERRRVMGRNGLAVFKERFSAAQVYPKMADHLEALAGLPARQRNPAGVV